MRLLYVTEPGAVLTRDGNRLVIRKSKDAVIQSIGIEHIEGIVMVGSCQLASGLAIELLERDIPVTWLSGTGRFFGRLEPTTGYNVERQLQQFEAHKNQTLRLALAKAWISAKIKNSKIVLKRYNRLREIARVDELCDLLESQLPKVEAATSLDEVMGHEGAVSRSYFEALSLLLPSEFKFDGRSRRPPKDPFNSLLSFGYTLLLYEIFTALTNKGLHPYLGLMHQPRRGHPALASDLIEEWRAVIVDSLAMKMITTGQLKASDFLDPSPDTGAVYLTREGGKLFIEQFERKLRSHNQYLSYVDYPLTFRESLAFQVGALTKAIELNDPSVYRPVVVR